MYVVHTCARMFVRSVKEIFIFLVLDRVTR
jgi:hypothetical protein